MDKIPSIVHLHPPVVAQRIFLTRNSPYFDRREALFAWSRPNVHDTYAYGDIPELEDLACTFDTSPLGITGTATAGHLAASIEDWAGRFPASTLVMEDLGDRIVIDDRRVGWEQRVIILEDPIEVEAYRSLRRVRSPGGVRLDLAAAGIDAGDDEILSVLARLLRDGLVFEDEQQYVALATTRSTQRMRAAAEGSAAASRHSPAGMRQTRVISPDGPYPLADELAALDGDGVTDIVVEGVVSLSAIDPERALRFLALLRDAQEHLIRVSYNAQDDLPGGLPGHLPAPGGDWGDRFGHLSYRKGPDFLVVRDCRSGEDETVVDGDGMRMLLRLAEPVETARLDQDESAALDDLERRRLVIRLAGFALALPGRRRHIQIGG
jgi:hypothetical protein